MRLRDGWLVEFVGRSGLVWSGVLTYTRIYVLAWAQCDKRGCDVLLFYFSLCLARWYLTGTEIRARSTDKKNHGIIKKI